MKPQKTNRPRGENRGAEYWAIRLDNGALSPEDSAELDAWLAADERHDGMLLRAQAALSYLDRGRALNARPANVFPLAGLMPRRHMLKIVGGGLATAAVVLVSILAFNQPSIETRIGEVRTVNLADGSQATVNTASRLKVHMEGKTRQVVLSDGEAWFKVAHDTSRPFIVEAGNARIRAVGTAFSVRRHNGQVEVLVTEGTVQTYLAGEEGRGIRMPAGTSAVVGDKKVGIVTAADPKRLERTLAWRKGELALDGESVTYAIGEINRYNDKQIVLEASQLRDEPLVGYFRTDEPEKFSRAVASLAGGRAIDEGDRIRIVGRQAVSE